ncbi:MAG: CopD family protein [Planctomycetia bacterium]|nr:CopD family protein [Planctomycetia bacterium]
MNDIDYVQLISRWLHITAAATAAGGAIFMKLALHPASETLPPEQRKQLREAVRSRWSKVVMGAITVLLATGIYNFIMIVKAYDFKGTPYQAIFGVKFLLALGIFALASILVGRSSLAQKLREEAGKWLTVLVGLILVLLFLSSFLKNIPHKPKVPAVPAAAIETVDHTASATLLAKS